MDAELAALAEAGAAALVQRMVTDGWEQARDQFARFFAHAGAGEGSDFAAELEASRADLTEAQEREDTMAESEVQADWRVRLRRAVRTDPASATELRALLEELLPDPDRRPEDVHNTITGGVHHGPVFVEGNYGEINLGSAASEVVRSTPPGPPFGDDDDEW